MYQQAHERQMFGQSIEHVLGAAAGDDLAYLAASWMQMAKMLESAAMDEGMAEAFRQEANKQKLVIDRKLARHPLPPAGTRARAHIEQYPLITIDDSLARLIVMGMLSDLQELASSQRARTDQRARMARMLKGVAKYLMAWLRPEMFSECDDDGGICAHFHGLVPDSILDTGTAIGTPNGAAHASADR